MPTINAYKTELRLLFQNLISNSIKFRNPDVPLEISLSAKEAKSSWKFSVSDNGLGLKPEDLEEIFILFKRTSNAKDIEGTGIGLAHCRKIVALHNGEIYADSKFGEGTTFHFNISKFIEE